MCRLQWGLYKRILHGSWVYSYLCLFVALRARKVCLQSAKKPIALVMVSLHLWRSLCTHVLVKLVSVCKILYQVCCLPGHHKALCLTFSWTPAFLQFLALHVNCDAQDLGLLVSDPITTQ